MSPYPIHTILFIDIETVSQYPVFNELPEAARVLWQHKAETLLRDKPDWTAADVYNRAAIYAEFGRIICISCGIISGSGSSKRISLKSFYGEDEKILLSEFCELLHRWSGDGHKYLCAHNGKEFDFPYLCRRIIINGLHIPSLLNLSGKRPWEIPHIDTLELWKFGDYKSFVSLKLLAHVLGIPTPKDDIDGSQVGDVYWQQHDLPRIVTYCQKDVVTVAQVWLRLNDEAPIRPENIEIK
ncbi:MAG: ribonuclease H-like domain-containing protein [Bacteroidota bacterium]|nr:ribonuclease H-like domain-containing protein [Bacteroidota bacterium]MDP4248333.1 ribonuclease H-like domain-containing protein [Bacteroidota bacterium]MDP4258470.1 ribonuclease H-like domain-containing protein [Bacteroidota bacterium]